MGRSVVNAPARVIPPTVMRLAPGPRAEHISIESSPDLETRPVRQPHRITLATFKLRSALRGCSTEVSILQDHHLAVRAERLHAPPLKYSFDLRFLNPKPVRVRHIAWNWIAATGVLLVAACSLITLALASSTGVMEAVLLGGIGSAIAAGVATFFSLRRTTESLEFVSVHGGAALVSILGGIGSAKAGKRFFIDVIKNINAAKAARPQSEQHFLRDEMREHHRLRELNVLSAAEYEASKARILKAHA